MRKLLVAFLFSGFLLVSPIVVRAEEVNIEVKSSTKSESTTVVVNSEKTSSESGSIERKRGDIQDRVETRMAAVKDMIDKKKLEMAEKISNTKDRLATREAERREMLEENVKSRMEQLFMKMNRRFRAAIGRMDQIVERLETRTTKLEEEGVAVTEVQADIDEIKVLLDLHVADLAVMESEFEKVLESANPREAMDEFRSLVKELRDQMVETHVKIGVVLEKIKSLSEDTN